jgi:hypothetical protein
MHKFSQGELGCALRPLFVRVDGSMQVLQQKCSEGGRSYLVC